MPDAQTLLNDVDPRSAWEPFSPTRRSRWDAAKASQLLRRAVFGASREQIQQAADDGLDATLDRLFTPGPDSDAFDRQADDLAAGAVASGEPRMLEAAWMQRMFDSPFRLRERLTLFWHDHFATSLAKVEDLALMQRQNDLLRRHSLGRFSELLPAMTLDPAMLIWLDSSTNRRGAPNENFAREVFELFGLGLGNYSERDIQEAARALTGWSVVDRRAHFTPAHFDDGEKSVFGQHGAFNAGDVVRLCLARPECARFIVRKLFQEFISDAARPSDELLAPLAEAFRQREYDVAWVVRTMLSCRLQYSPAAVLQRVKSPVELVVGIVLALEGRVSPARAAEAAAEMGQRLFFPPNVKGWDGGRLWINSSTLLLRQNLAFHAARGDGESLRLDPARLAARYGASSPEEIVALFLSVLLQGPDHPAKDSLVRQLGEREPSAGAPIAARVRQAQLARAAAHLVMTLPEHQLV